MRSISALFAITLILASPARAASPGAAATLSIVPGLGQTVNGQPLEGLGWFVSTIGLMFISRDSKLNDVGYKLWQYNIYDAYRDAGAQDAAQNSALENYVAFLNPVNLADPYSVGTIGYSAYRARTASSTAHLGPDNRAAGAFYYGFVGFGEEGLFRGALYPGLSHVFGSYWLGALTSSALFAVSHLPNKQAYYHSGRGLAELFVFGMILCAQTTYNHFDLRHSIFTHAWYDFVIDYESKASTASASLTPELRVGFRF